MPGDYSRKTFDPQKHYSGVLMQQGRVQLDADWNEQLAIQQHRTRTEARDVIGACGVPKNSDGFKIGTTPDGKDLTIFPGRIYVDGLLCELEATLIPVTFQLDNQAVQDHQAVVPILVVDNRELQVGQWVEIAAAGKKKLLQITALDEEKGLLTFNEDVKDFQNADAATVRRVTTYMTQPDYPNPEHTRFLTSPPTSPPSGPEQFSLQEGTYVVFLDVWRREVNALDDPRIREKALGGPDTTTRLKIVWQVRLLPVSGGVTSPPTSPPSGEVTCETPFAEWDKLVALGTGTLNARTKVPDDQKDPCLLPPSSGYRRLENQLYRVEVHKGGARADATFKWSRDNATVETLIEKIDNNTLTVSDVGKDEVLGFASGSWVEMVDEESALKSAPHQLVQIDKVDSAKREVTLQTPVPALAQKPPLKLRRWDQTGNLATTDGVQMAADWIDLEGGIQVQFSAGDYHSGDYWLIPARTATGDIEWPPFETPNTKPIPQPPVGVRHYYCRLALLEVDENGTVNVRDDCRNPFPTLTEICAEDVCFDNSECQLPDVETVQDALDRLCAARDLRFHNKHLHGWGIVCGLQVECGPDPPGQPCRHLTVRKGYAIDCEGNDILLEQDDQIDLLEMIAGQLTSPPSSPPSSPAISGVGDGEVCLVLELDEKRKTRYRLEKYDPSWGGIPSVLTDTLLMDVYNDCIKSLVDFVKDEFTVKPGEAGGPVSPTQKRITTFSNLLIQLANPINGSFVFLSGEKGQSGENLEDTILRNFYNKLRARLQSHTFCAMFEGARSLPEYPYRDLRIATIFGKGFHKRLRIEPGGNRAYSLGAGATINVYDLQKNEMEQELEFPGGSSAVVQDVAFSKDGRQLYAVALLNNKDSMFAVADVAGSQHVWRKPTVICDVLLVTLGTNPSLSEKVYAIGKGKGLYEINPQNVEAAPTPFNAFNAVGHLVISDRTGHAFATGQGGQADTYDRVLRLNLKTKDDNPPAFMLPTVNDQPMSGRDDIAVVFEGTRTPKLYVVADPPTGQSNKQLVIFNAANPQTSAAVRDLGEDTAIRLAYNPVTNHMMVTYEDSYRIALLNVDDALVPNFRHPVQISPLSITVAPDNETVYVLNYASNTIGAIPAELLTPGRQIPLQDLVNYRAGMLNAFADLLGGLLQYLKDCLCDHFLIQCPTCDEDDKIYLACIAIKNGQVYQVCNFSRRKYVKSFPTVEYWLSLVPVIPLLGRAVEALCCAVLPDFFGKFNAPRVPVPDGNAPRGDNRLKSAQLREGVTFAQQTDFRGVVRERFGELRVGRQLATDWLGATVARENIVQPQAIKQSDVIGQPVNEARRKLEAANIVVDRVESYVPSLGARNLARFGSAPGRLEGGARVTLVEQDGVVRYYARAEEVPAPVQDLRVELEDNKRAVAENTAALGEVSSLRGEVNALRNELLRVQRTHQEALAARDQEITTLKATVEDFRSHLQTLANALPRPRPRRER